jgi:hypothetical protein
MDEHNGGVHTDAVMGVEEIADDCENGHVMEKRIVGEEVSLGVIPTLTVVE